MTFNSHLWFAKLFPVSTCDSNASAAVLGGSIGLFLLRYTQEINQITEHNAFVSASGSEIKSPYRSPRLPGVFTDPLVIKSTLLKHFVKVLLPNTFEV